MPSPMSGHGSVPKVKNVKLGVKTLVHNVKPYRWLLVISFVFAALGAAASCSVPILLKHMITEGFTPTGVDMVKVSFWGCICLAIYIFSILCNTVQTYIMVGISQKLTFKIRKEVIDKVNKLPLKYFDSVSTGDTMSKITNDADSIGENLNQSFSIISSSLMLLVGLFIAMFVTAWQLALVCVIVVPLAMLCLGLIGKKTQKYFIKQQTVLGKINEKIEEVYTNQNIVTVFDAKEKEGKQFDSTNNELRKNSLKAQFFSGMMMPLMGFIHYFDYFAVSLVATILIVNGVFGTVMEGAAVFATFILFTNLLQSPIAQIGQGITSIQIILASSENIAEFLALPEMPEEQKEGAKIEEFKGEVEFKNVDFSYNESKKIIDNFNINITSGQKVAIVGPTGSGKTTITNLLLRFYEISGGDILIDGVSIKDMKKDYLRSLFSLVLQDSWLFEGSVVDNIKFCLDKTEEEVVEICKQIDIDYMISSLPHGYQTIITDDNNFSSGEKQLLTIARCMLQNNPIVILDEATSNIDTRTELKIQNALDKLTAGRTSFVIAHRLSTIKNADLIIVLKDGKIIETGNHNQLIQNSGFYTNLYKSQFSIED